MDLSQGDIEKCFWYYWQWQCILVAQWTGACVCAFGIVGLKQPFSFCNLHSLSISSFQPLCTVWCQINQKSRNKNDQLTGFEVVRSDWTQQLSIKVTLLCSDMAVSGVRLVTFPEPFRQECVCSCCNAVIFPLLLWTTNRHASKQFWQRPCTNWIFLPLSFSIYDSLPHPTSKLNFWPLRQKAEIKQLTCDSMWVAAWQVWQECGGEALKVAWTGGDIGHR